MQTYAIAAVAGALFGCALVSKRVSWRTQEICVTAIFFGGLASFCVATASGVAMFTATRLGNDSVARVSSLALRGSLHGVAFAVTLIAAAFLRA